MENEGVRLVVAPLLPDRSLGWRVSDVTRTSVYEAHSPLKEATPSIRYRSFAPFRAAERFEFLFAMRVDGDENARDWQFTQDPAGWTLRAAGLEPAIRPSVPAGLELA